MTELSFLLDLLLNEKLSKQVKTKLTERIKLIECTQVVVPRGAQIQSGAAMQMLAAPSMVPGVPTHLAPQSASTLANLSKVDGGAVPTQTPIVASVAAANAMLDRQAAINASVNGDFKSSKPAGGRTSPRKF